MTASDLLHSTRKLISDPRNLIQEYQGVQATDARNREVRADDPTAVRFTLDGALRHCADLSTKEGQDDHFQAVQYLLLMRPKRRSIAEINDNCSHAEIIAMLERAAAALNVDGRLEAA
jgi:hypothetical protein